MSPSGPILRLLLAMPLWPPLIYLQIMALLPPGAKRLNRGAMADFTETLTPDHMAMIARQSVFFVATAADAGRINLSPKGLDGTFRVLSPARVAWLDLAGSGNETNAHLLAAQTDRG